MTTITDLPTPFLTIDLDAVEATGAAGVHLPGGSDPVLARRRFPEGLIGVSAHSAAEATALLRAGADYVTLSPIFLTDSKPGYGPALGPDALAAAAATAPGPVIALAGITPDNAAQCLAAGANYFLDKSAEFERIPEILRELTKKAPDVAPTAR